MGDDATRLPFKFVTHNVKRLNSPIKWRMAFQQYKSLITDMLLLQEMLFPLNYKPNFLYHYYPHFYLANGPGGTEGIVICFSKQVSFSLEKRFCDSKTCYLLLVGNLEGSLIPLTLYYAPNSGYMPFFCFMLCPWT